MEDNDDEEEDDDEDDETALSNRADALSEIDVTATYSFLTDVIGETMDTLDEFKMKICVEIAQCRFQLGNVGAALAAL